MSRTTASSTTIVETYDLWSRSRDGDRAARDELICKYWPLVGQIARGMSHTVPSSIRDDLVGFGAIGLIDAVEKFRAELGCPFESYAGFRIRGAIRDGIRALSWFPRGASQRANRRIRTIELVDFQTSVTRSGVHLRDTVGDDQLSPAEVVIIDEDHAEMADIVNHLPERERSVVIDLYYKDRLLRHIGEKWNLSESRICQLHKRALELIEEKFVTA